MKVDLKHIPENKNAFQNRFETNSRDKNFIELKRDLELFLAYFGTFLANYNPFTCPLHCF